LAKHYGEGPIKIADIAKIQAIPGRFLENILSALKQGGFVTSIRGRNGGYTLAKTPESITAGSIITFCDGPVAPVGCISGSDDCSLMGTCAFMPMWKRAQAALSNVYDNTTFADLVEEDRRPKVVANYSI
jgi:Rrf2 family protein